MNKILEEHRVLIESKMVDFQEQLKVKIKKFIEDLEFYKKKVDELEDNGDIEDLAKYTKKATSLDNR